jgi:hypothetical protein
MAAPADALVSLAHELRDGESVIASHIQDPGDARPQLGLLGAAGPRAAPHEAEYALVVEAVLEGYLLHYGTPRIVDVADSDLALLAGDYLYALGLQRLASLGDLDAVSELSDLISLLAQLHAEDRDHRSSSALWLAGVVAVGYGATPAHEDAKRALRRAAPDAADRLLAGARETTIAKGGSSALEAAADAIDFAPASG